ncbi:MAG: uroporphyrinogen III synthase [Azospira oryzae]|nr:MAG: uroporphyrinogen III synthase [Azospira oryzae]PZP82796.1 MAG: uroporphyrinogen III synthase [Azospira oryzae]
MPHAPWETEKPLAGLGIAVTRPVHQADELVALIRAAGGVPVLCPALEIQDVEDLGPLVALIDRLETFDLAIFISPNAVAKAMNLIRARSTRWPAGLRIAAIGKGSARELAKFGVTEVIAPAARFDSEALLELPPLKDVAGKRVVIFRGDGGRELLGDTLVARGARIEYAECYRRTRPRGGAANLLRAWARNELAAVTVTSSEALHNLFDMVGALGQQWLKKTPLFVPHERIAAAARALGLDQVIVTDPGDEGLVRGIVEWFRNKRGVVAPENKPS